MNLTEPILNEPMRYSATPVRYPTLAKMLEKAQDLFWVQREIIPDLMRDKKGFAQLPPNIHLLLEHVLAFFAVSDGIVNEIIGDHLKPGIRIREYLDLASMQEAIEVVHNQVYAAIVDAYFGTERANQLKDSMINFPAVRDKVNFIRGSIAAAEDTTTHSKLALQIFMAAIMEGLFFSGSFCVIFWINHSGYRMPGLAKANEFISRDEGLHTETSIEIYRSHIVHRLPQERAHEIVTEAMLVESKFIDAALPNGMAGMNMTLMLQYLRFVADQLLGRLGYDPLFRVTNPFPFMDKQSTSVRSSDFFVTQVSEYAPSAVGDLEY